MTIITLTTDFGLIDGYVGIIKGVILGLVPGVRLVDLSHDIAPQNIRQAAYILQQAVPYFPAGTIHLVVVDPGVGSARRALIVRSARAHYVGPDNGVLSHALVEPGAEVWQLDRPEYWLPQVSHTFHGRDVFAPAAAHLAAGVPAEQMGSPITDPIQLPPIPPPIRYAPGRLLGHIIYIDRFGNLISDVPASWVSAGRWCCRIAGRTMPLQRTYADAAIGELLGLISSGGTVEVAVRNGSAATALQVSIGEELAVEQI